MPELPEVEMRRRFVEAHALNQPVQRAAILDPTVLNGISKRAFEHAFKNQLFTATHRHGKWLFVRASSKQWLVLHFGMTGNLRCYPKSDGDPQYVRVRFDFANGNRLAFTDPRKFGETGLTTDVEAFLRKRRWGPDPTLPGFDRETFRQVLDGRKGVLKSILMNQRVIAGIGNLYADEMLFQTGLHPDTRAASLKPATVDRLYDAMMDVFAASLAVDTNYEALPNRFHLRHRHYSAKCPKCGAPFSLWKAAGRTAYYCARHQRKRS